MKKSTLLFVFISLFCFSQNQRFTYLYQFVPDSTNKAERKAEILLLEVLPKFSKFYSQEVFKSDSAMNVAITKELAATGSINIKSNMKKGAFRDVVIKEFPNKNVFLFTRIGRTEFKVADERKMIWKIQPEKEKIGVFTAQKATTNFAGRKWTAWFTTEIALQDGPYKFNGLPGLIIKLIDDSDSHSFELKEIKNLTPEEIKEIDPAKNFVFNFREQLQIDRTKFKNHYLENREDPNKTIRSAMGQSDVKIINNNGNSMFSAEDLRLREKQQKEKNAKDNNILEIDLLK